MYTSENGYKIRKEKERDNKIKKLRKIKLKKCIGVLGILIALIIITGCVNNFGKFVITKNNVRAANKNEKTIETTKPSKKSDWKLVLVNYQNKINSDAKIDVVQLKNGQAIDKRCYEELQQMMDDCRDEGLDPIIVHHIEAIENKSFYMNRKFMIF